MVARPVGDKLLIQAVELYEELGSNAKVGAELDRDEATIRRWRKEAVDRGLHLSSGARNAVQNAGLSGAEANGGWIHNYDKEGKKVGTTRWTAPETPPEEIIDRMVEAFKDIPPAEPVISPKDNEADLLAFYPHADVHLGMRVTADQSGKRPYNREIASQRFREGASKCMGRSPDAGTALILNMGDLLHANDDTDSTPRSKHKLKVDGSHHENFELAIELAVYKIDLALQKHENVVYRGIPGNHDPNIPGPLSMALRERYRNEPRCEIKVTEDAIWKFNWGKVFLAGAHGDGRNAKSTCPELPGRFPEEWGKATQWHYFSGHFHEYKSEHHGPVRHHQLPSVCSADTHSAWSPYSDNSAMMAFIFSKDGITKDTVCVGV